MGTKKFGPERGATEAEIVKIVTLRDRHGLTFAVIGSRLGIIPSTISDLYRAAKARAA